MSAAKAIQQIDSRDFAWLTIEDDSGNLWNYKRTGAADLAESPQIEGHLKGGRPFRAGLVRDHDGHPLLRQSGPGLPGIAVVEFIDDPSNLYLTALGLPGKAEYTLENRPPRTSP